MADAPQSIVYLNNIQRVFTVGTQKVHALKGIDLQINTNQMVSLKGRSGSGKTTLLNCVGGLDQPTEGEIQKRPLPSTTSSANSTPNSI